MLNLLISNATGGLTPIPKPMLLHFSFDMIWDSFFYFMNWELNFGDLSITLWHFLLGSIVVFSIAVAIIRRLLQ